MKNIQNLLVFKVLLLSIILSGCKKPTLPTVSLGTVTEITDVSAKVDINVTSDGNADIVERGIIYSNGNCSSCGNSKKITTSGTMGTATIIITGLTKATQYKISAYAINKMGQFTSPEISFTTSAQKAVMNDANMTISSITAATAFVNNYGISDDGGAQPTNRGVCWSTNSAPTIADNKTNDTVTTKISCCFNTTIPNLKANTKYFVRGYVINSAGVSYTKELSFTTIGNFSCQPNVIEVNNTVRNIVNVTGNKFLLTGQFTSINGLVKKGITRFNDDGSIDNTFNVDIPNFTPNTPFYPTILSGGKMFIPGTLGSGQTLVKINENGTLDESFKTGTGANSSITHYSVLSDGKVLLIGGFSTYNGIAANKVVRLNADGTIDANFVSSVSTDFGVVNFGHVLSNGKILINSATRGNFLLNSNGSVDTTSSFKKLGSEYQIIARLKDDKFLCNYNSSKLIRLNSDGTIDNTFKEGLTQGAIIRFVVESADSKYYIGGAFTVFNQTPVFSFIRLNNDGTLDNTFNVGVGFSGQPYSLAVSNDNKLLIGGTFSSFRELPALRFIKINLDGSVCR